LREHYLRVEANNGHSLISTAKRLLRIGRAMVRDCRIYLPTNSLNGEHPDAMSVEQYLLYHQVVSERVCVKWKRYDLSGISDDCNYLQRWLKEIHEWREFTMKNKN